MKSVERLEADENILELRGGIHCSHFFGKLLQSKENLAATSTIQVSELSLFTHIYIYNIYIYILIMLTNQDQIWNNLPRYMNIYIWEWWLVGVTIPRWPQQCLDFFGNSWEIWWKPRVFHMEIPMCWRRSWLSRDFCLGSMISGQIVIFH